MKRLARHVSGTVLMAMVLVQVILLLLDLVFSFIGELDSVSGGYGVVDAFLYTLLIVPGHAYEILPVSALVGALVGLGTLASQAELTIIRAAGVSTWRIVWWTMRGALLIVLFGLALGEWVVPPAQQQAETLKALAKGQDYEPGRITGYWQWQGQELLHIQRVTPDGHLLGVHRYQFDTRGGLNAAQQALQGQATEAGNWRLSDLRDTQFLPDGRAVAQRDPSGVTEWSLAMTPEDLRTAAAAPDELRLAALWRHVSYLEAQGLDPGQHALQLWKKLLAPLAILAMVLIACSFIFGPLRSVTLGLRILVGILVGLLFRYSQDAFGFASLLFQWSPFWALMIPIVLCFALGGLALRRVR